MGGSVSKVEMTRPNGTQNKGPEKKSKINPNIPENKSPNRKLLGRVTLLSWMRNNASARMIAFDKGGVVQCLMRVERGEGGTSN